MELILISILKNFNYLNFLQLYLLKREAIYDFLPLKYLF